MTTPLKDSEYQRLADAIFARVEDALSETDVDVIDCERSGDVVTLLFRGTKKAILNTQRPTQQIWLAAGAHAWHFFYDAGSASWRSDKDASLELFQVLSDLAKEMSGVTVGFGN